MRCGSHHLPHVTCLVPPATYLVPPSADPQESRSVAALWVLGQYCDNSLPQLASISDLERISQLSIEGGGNGKLCQSFYTFLYFFILPKQAHSLSMLSLLLLAVSLVILFCKRIKLTTRSWFFQHSFLLIISFVSSILLYFLCSSPLLLQFLSFSFSL